MKRLALLSLLSLLVLNLSACNTLSGIGKDLKKGVKPSSARPSSGSYRTTVPISALRHSSQTPRSRP
jgi:predicted small secreted protein